MRLLASTAAGVASAVLLVGCASGAAQAPPESAKASTETGVPASVQVTCDAFFNATKVRMDAGVTITPADYEATTSALQEAITTANAGAEDVAILGQVAEELTTMRAELAKPQPNTFLVSEASELVTRVCLNDYKVTPPEWLGS